MQPGSHGSPYGGQSAGPWRWGGKIKDLFGPGFLDAVNEKRRAICASNFGLIDKTPIFSPNLRRFYGGLEISPRKLGFCHPLRAKKGSRAVPRRRQYGAFVAAAQYPPGMIWGPGIGR
ncbi:MAG: hypothetical protein CM15mP21_5500 [Hyphomicrobiales bacterium]|nr:MAG: hypothetical protein CM15mP21_5500 [Hyphomicrobiales bacterium]